MARMNKSQQYAILWLNSIGKDQVEIAKELDLELKQVQKTLEKSKNVNQQSSVQTTSEVVNKPTSKDLMIRHTSAKRNNSVAIMTKEASEVNDHAKKVNPAHPNINKNIFRPNG
jgi:hypothetical protein